MIPSTTPPASAENPFSGATISAYTAIPITIEGTPFSTSAVNRTSVDSFVPRPYSER